MRKKKDRKRRRERIRNSNIGINREWFKQDKIIRLLLIAIFMYIYINFNKKNNILISSIFLSLATALITDFLININYNKHLKDALYDILTSPKIMKDFIDSKYKIKIMRAAMQVNLGENITKALYNNILDNYLYTYNKILRKDFQFNVYIENSDEYEHFYLADMKIVFKIPQHNEDLELDVFASKKHDKVVEKVKDISGLNKQLVFPMVLAEGIDDIEPEKLFDLNISVNSQEVTEFVLDKQYEKKVKLSADEEITVVRINIKTLLNKMENFFQEDILCIHNGYTLTLGYETNLLRDCKCYHSCKSKELVTVENNNSISVHTDGILLPENNFVFIWSNNDEVLELSKNEK